MDGSIDGWMGGSWLALNERKHDQNIEESLGFRTKTRKASIFH